MIVERKPPRAEAVQWDGSMDGAQAVLDLIRKSNVSTGFFIRTRVDVDSEAGYSTITFDRIRGYIRREDGATMVAEDWFIIHPDGNVEILPDDVFKRDYAEVE